MVRKPLTAWLFVLPALLVFTALVIAPILWSLSLSLVRWNGLGKQVFVGFGNYLQMLRDKVFVEAFFNTLFFSIVGSVVQLLAGMAMAVSLLAIRRFRNLIRVAYFVPAVVSSVAIAQIFGQVLAVQPEGLVNALLGAVGLGQYKAAFLSEPRLTLLIVTLVDAYKFCAIYMAIYYSALISIDSEMLDASLVDGANWLQQLLLVRIPAIRATIAVTIVLVVSGTLKGFDVSFVLTGGGPGASSELVSTYLYKSLFNSSNFGYGSAIAVFLAIECLLVVIALRWALRSERAAT
ncbi:MULTISPECIES: sugar ABC transporter permease [unclassified Devosia]|uniref:carbohydrate ABC transporter permease n=1 Tax=unclassified Devosia TaxID=196773 RepID=UPI0008686189|nr:MULTISPECIES: sugar ABC transporter permease [unclassified Devosia]MBN9364411.1 sugar ABC transporter permease [Devosia sp.]ODS87016.1 MAG: sugar ABC transporter permease [Devosia sp. SCN 66-27]OJX20803.1 MAG: sugar ABC transporter permease [Devosia sp. 66-14]